MLSKNYIFVYGEKKVLIIINLFPQIIRDQQFEI